MVKESCGGKDPFYVSGEQQLKHAKDIGLGNAKYQLKTIE
jgi:uncharacterized Fe-S center protein